MMLQKLHFIQVFKNHRNNGNKQQKEESITNKTYCQCPINKTKRKYRHLTVTVPKHHVREWSDEILFEEEEQHHKKQYLRQMLRDKLFHRNCACISFR
jgi:hypothetical protein